MKRQKNHILILSPRKNPSKMLCLRKIVIILGGKICFFAWANVFLCEFGESWESCECWRLYESSKMMKWMLDDKKNRRMICEKLKASTENNIWNWNSLKTIKKNFLLRKKNVLPWKSQKKSFYFHRFQGREHEIIF